MAKADLARTGSTIRCAIYTRKSSDEGLEQEFNSLDAQREACEAYIVSQRHAGWVALADMYDDGGLSGGTMERPALKRLLEDIKASKVQIVVVYKVDRLTRSLADFAKIVDVLDAHNASFVSVTQQFNTTTSMGRLTLNMLLSFAQFECEIAGERIRDKIAASKKKGMWMGGGDRTVDLPALCGTGLGRAAQGRTRPAGYCLPRLPLLDAAEPDLSGRNHSPRHNLPRPVRGHHRAGALADRAGQACRQSAGACIGGGRGGAEFVGRFNRRCRRQSDDAGPRHKEGQAIPLLRLGIPSGGRSPASPERKRVPAGDIEALVLDRLRAFFSSRTDIGDALAPLDLEARAFDAALRSAFTLSKRWLAMPPVEMKSLVLDIVERVTIAANRIEIWLNRAKIAAALEAGEGSQRLDIDPITLSIEAKLRRAGKGKRLVIANGAETEVNAGLVELIKEAFAIRNQFLSGSHDSIEAMSGRLGMNKGRLTSLVRLSYLGPEVVRALLGSGLL